MNKQEILNHYKEEDRLLIAKIFDKIEIAEKKNKITNTDFLDLHQKNIVQKVIKSIQCENYLFFGGDENSERTVLIIYPSKFSKEIVEKNYNNIMQIIEIILPNDLQGKYSHRDYLGGLMKLGLKREKIGDIIVFNEGANIIVLNEIIKFVKDNISSLTRFSKAQIKVKEINELYKQEVKKIDEEIIVSSLRLDNIVSEIAKTSRTKAEEIINSGRVFLNFENITKTSKTIKLEDVLTIRGKGRFKIKEIIGKTKKGRIILLIEKFV